MCHCTLRYMPHAFEIGVHFGCVEVCMGPLGKLSFETSVEVDSCEVKQVPHVACCQPRVMVQATWA